MIPKEKFVTVGEARQQVARAGTERSHIQSQT